jgi:very-short-patch-repair endonuclease
MGEISKIYRNFYLLTETTMNNHYNKTLREYAHELRNETVSRAEKYIWKAALRRSQLGVKFKRQRPIDRLSLTSFVQS